MCSPRPGRLLALIACSAFFFGLTACGGGGSSAGTSNPSTPAPAIQFSASSTSIAQGTSTTLTWAATNASSVSINNGVGQEPVSGSVKVTPGATTTYTATASQGAKTASQQVTVTVTASSATLTSIQINPAKVYLRVPATTQLSAIGTFSDGSTSDVTSQLTWTSGNSAAASVSSAGLVTAAAPGTAQISGTLQGVSATTHVAVSASASAAVLTYHNDIARDGAVTNETTLTNANVNQKSFGKRFSYSVDGEIYAQPLYLSNLNVQGTTYNVVFVETENDSVYAFDADGVHSGPLWKVSLGTSPASHDSEGVSPELGITSTPVLDASTGTLYVVNIGLESNKRVFRLHALDATTGTEKLGGPVKVTGSVAGTGYDSVNGQITLETNCYQRAGLALSGNDIYVAFGHCSHGWIFSYDKTSLQQHAIFNSTPDGGGGAFWNSGGAPAFDSGGNLFLISATDAGDPAPGYNDSILQLSPTLTVNDYFTPSNDAFLRANDADLGSGDLVLMPDNASSTPHEVIGGGKDGRIFVINRDNMGKFTPNGPDAVIQKVQTGTQQFDNIFSTPAYWNGNFYVHCENDVLKAYSWSTATGLLSTTYISKGTAKFGVHGATPTVSSSGGSDAIVWEIESTNATTGGPAILRAIDANDVSNELYNSSQAGSRDTAGPAVKFVVPTVADGQVFVGTGSELDIYGLL